MAKKKKQKMKFPRVPLITKRNEAFKTGKEYNRQRTKEKLKKDIREGAL